jgi:hypothetical protein
LNVEESKCEFFLRSANGCLILKGGRGVIWLRQMRCGEEFGCAKWGYSRAAEKNLAAPNEITLAKALCRREEVESKI